MNQHTRLARHFASLQALGFVTILAACGGGGVSVPAGVVVGGTPAPAPGTPPPPPPPAPNPSASTCVDPAPSVTQTAGFDAATVPANTGTAVSANGGTVCFTAATTGAVRSTTAISQGSYYYFEATRSNSVSIGVGTAAAPLAPTGASTSDIASTAQSLILTNGTAYTKGANIPNFNVGTETKFGFAVDYRGPHPVVYVLGSTQGATTISSPPSNCTGGTASATDPCVYGRYVLGAVTDPVFIYASGNSSNGGAAGKVSINTGGNPTDKAFTYAPNSVRQKVRSRFFKGEVGLNTEWAGTSATPASALPTITASSRTRSVIKTDDTTPFTPSFSVSTTLAGTNVQWLSDTTGSILIGSSTLTLTDPTVQAAIGVDDLPHRIQAIVTDPVTKKVNAVEFTVTLTTIDRDHDGDGLTYSQEKSQSPPTDPANPDTNGDGIADGVNLTPTPGALAVVLHRETGASGFATSQGVILDDDQLSIVLNSDLNPDCLAGTLPSAFNPQPLTEEQCDKRAIRATSGVKQGEFRYYESHRLIANGINGQNMGQGFITTGSKIDPFCCVAVGATTSAGRDARTPFSFMLNSGAGIWDTLVSIDNFNTANTSYIGFAVDYTGSVPVAYAITDDSGPVVHGPYSISGFTGDAIPFIYGHPASDTAKALEINFGLKAFHYDARTLLQTAGVANANAIVLGVGVHRRP